MANVNDNYGSTLKQHYPELKVLQFDVLGKHKHVQKLIINAPELREIEYQSFGTHKELFELSILAPKLQKWPDTLFSSLKSLKYLELNIANIGYVKPKFKKTIKTLKITANVLDLTPFKDTIFSNLKSLTLMHKNGQNILLLRNSYFKKLTKLKFLKIVNADFTELDEKFEKLLPKLNHLIIINSQLKMLLLHRTKKMELLELINCKINFAQRKKNSITLVYFTKINILNLTEMSLEYYPKIKHLLINGDVIHKINDYSFTCNTRLTYLNLASNNIHELSSEAFFGLTNLLELYLGHNRIKQLHDMLFDINSKLVILDLHNNRLEKLSKETFKRLKMLKELRVFGNNGLDLNQDIIDLNIEKIFVDKGSIQNSNASKVIEVDSINRIYYCNH